MIGRPAGPPRRSEEAIASALLMDRSLRSLFVEGPNDRSFLRWILGEEVACEILTIDLVDISVSSGGNRARAVRLAEHLRSQLNSHGEVLNRVRILIDADFDHLDGRIPALPLMLTDGRSMESYFLRSSTFDKIFGLALMAQHIDADAVFQSTIEVATLLASIREIDRQRSLELPFQTQKFRAFVDVDSSGIPSLKLAKIISNLLVQAGLDASSAQDVMSAVEDVAGMLRERDPLHVVHGHDLERILGEILQRLKYPRNQASQLMRSTFERAYLHEYPMLSKVVSFTVAA